MAESFEDVYRQNYQRLYTLAFRITGSAEEAEDALQTAFLNAYRAYEKFRGESSVYTWLYRIVVNAARKSARGPQKLPVQQYSEEQQIPESEIYRHINRFGQVEDEALTNLTKETCLQMFMNCMPSKYRAVFTLRSILHCSVDESADVLEISREAVKTNLHRARQIIRDHMDGRCSLVKPGAFCDCRAYAAYLQESGKAKTLPNITAIQNREQRAVAEFREEICDLLEIEKLYDTRIQPPDYTGFIQRIKARAEDGSSKLLNY